MLTVKRSILALTIQICLWVGFLADYQRITAGPVLLINDFIAAAVAIAVLVAGCLQKTSLAVIGMLLANALSLLMVDFAFIYWSYGSTINFTIRLTHLDAIYFALGTLTTAGTGNISAISEIARGIQSVQMFLDLGLVLFAIGLVIARFSPSGT